ncbi:MAG: hypothetical protein WA782_07390 [Sulfitobacter sp.]
MSFVAIKPLEALFALSSAKSDIIPAIVLPQFIKEQRTIRPMQKTQITHAATGVVGFKLTPYLLPIPLKKSA